MGLVKPRFKQRQDFSQMRQRVEVSAHDLGAVVHPGQPKLDGGGPHGANHNLPFAREQKNNCRGQSQLGLEDE